MQQGLSTICTSQLGPPVEHSFHASRQLASRGKQGFLLPKPTQNPTNAYSIKEQSVSSQAPLNA